MEINGYQPGEFVCGDWSLKDQKGPRLLKVSYRELTVFTFMYSK